MASITIAGTLAFADDTKNRKIDKSLVDYVDLMFSIMNIDITYERFQQMSDGERKQFIRDIKINKIIDGTNRNRK